MTWESFSTGALAIFIFSLMFAGIFVLRSIFQDENTADARRKKNFKPEVQPESRKGTPQPTSAQSYESMTQKALKDAVRYPDKEDAVLVLYESNWAGQAAENGEDKVFLTVFEDECVITYERRSRNCYATPPIEDVRTEERHRSLLTIASWSPEELLLYINRAFHLSINIRDCCSEAQYLAWIENHNTEFYSMEIMLDGKRQTCMVRRENEKSCEEVRFQGQTYFWKRSKAITGLMNYDYAAEVSLNGKVYYLYYTQIPNKNDTLYWIVRQITESTFERLKHRPCNTEDLVFEREIGQIGGYEPARRSEIYKILALATGRTIGYYRAADGTNHICLERIP